MKALDRKLLRDLLYLRSQMVAIVLVVASGITLFVSMRNMHVYLVTTQQNYYDEYRFADVFASLKQAPNTVAAELERIPGVATVSTRIVRDVTLDVPGLEEPATGRLISIPEQRVPIVNDLHIRRGRYIELGGRGDVLASEAFSTANALGAGDSIGAVINGRWQILRIAGIAISPEYVYEIRGGGELLPDNRRFGVMWMGRSALSVAFDMEGAFNDVALRLAPGASQPEVIARVDRVLDRYGGIGAYGREDQVSNRFLSDEIAETQVTSVLVPSIFLAITAFLLHIVLSRLVATQIDQIGTLKAFGYADRTIGAHYGKLALTPVLIGSAIGVGGGLWLAAWFAEIYARLFQFPALRYEPSLAVIGAALLVGGGTGLLGAMSAVRSAVRLPPAEAMRPPVPPRFAVGLVERLHLTSRLSLPVRIILRNIERRPMKAFLSTVGIGLAYAVLMSGRYGYDAINHLKQVQFEYVQREDVMVAFHDPRPRAAGFELDHMPGVTRVELFRAVPARLRNGYRHERSVIFGIDPDAELRRIVDQDLVTHRPPPDGLLLTAYLGKMLGVRSGDTLTVEVMEGARPTRRIPVAGLVSEMLGTAVYMDRKALSRMMREQEALSGAFLDVDTRSETKLYDRLKRTPAVSGVAIRRATLASFEDTIGENFRISVTILVVAACIIAFGMVYNGGRVALSERARELGSLRVLGFSRGEVARMLLGEQALLTVAAAPLGFLIGYALCALITLRMTSELYRVPLTVRPLTYVFAAVVVAATAAISALVIRRRINRLNLVEVLKTRE